MNTKIYLISNNNIFIFQKDNFELKNRIKFDNWYLPRGLHVDKEDNVFTIAHNIDKTLNCIQRVNLNISKMNDMIIIDDKLYVINEVAESPINIFEFV